MNALDSAMYSTLAASTAITALTNGGTASPSVYHFLAPEGADPPYVIYQTQAPSVPFRTHGYPIVYEDVTMTVKAVTEGHSALQAGTIASNIAALLNGSVLSITGHTVLMLRREMDVDYYEVLPGGQRYHHRGGQYRIWAAPA
jgi:hypothetical protein